MAHAGLAGPTEAIHLAGRALAEPELLLSILSDDETDYLGGRFAAVDPWVQYPYPASALQSYFTGQEPGAPRLGIRSGAALLGAIGIRFNWLSGPYIQFLGLLPEHQSRGYGKRVLGWLDDDARAHGARNMWVAASDFNAEAIKFYERYGFTRLAVVDDLVYDGRNEVLLRKRLNIQK